MGARSRRSPHLSLLFSTLLLFTFPLAPASGESTPRSEDGSTVESEGATWNIFPGPRERFFPEAVADIEGARFGATTLSVSDPDLEGAGGRRFFLELGSRLGIAQWTTPRSRWQGLRIELEVGFQGQFDPTKNYDNLGWDGVYGLWVSTASRDGTALRAGLHHISSHVGDEYAEATGRRRLEYTREELLVSVSRELDFGFRVYGEAGWAWELRNPDAQEASRGRVGVERFAPPRLFGDRAGWYFALDLAAWEERGWDLETTAQLGLWFPAGDRRWRLGLAFHDGALPIGELLPATETSVGAGLWLDL